MSTDITFFLGPMFSGKTTEVVGALTRHRWGGQDCVLVKSTIDERYSGRTSPTVHTHEGVVARCEPRGDRKGGLRVATVPCLLDLDLAENETIVGVDEGQFFSDLRKALLQWSKKGCKVFVSALDGDFQRKMFSPIVEALPLATHCHKLRAVCMSCQAAEAAYTQRLQPDVEETIVVGGSESYAAVCGKCYEKGIVGEGGSSAPP